MNIAIVGCGFVADYYLATLPSHPELKLLGVWDQLPERTDHFSNFHQVAKYESLEHILGDERVDMVLNLTNPRSHYEISKAALEQGKHVYSEKPLAMDMDQANELVALADSKNLLIASAPCSLLGETAQTIWKALRNDAVGKVRVVYAEMDDGLVHLMPYDKWLSVSGIPWPSKDEFEIGCTLEHAGYYLAWLVAYFGPATSVTSFASIQVEDKLTAEPLNMDSPDFSVACVQFESGVVARLTCSILAPHDHTLRIVGDEGSIRLHPPFYRPEPMTLHSGLAPKRKTASARCDQYKSSEVGQKVNRILDKVAVRFSSASAEQKHIPGNGLSVRDRRSIALLATRAGGEPNGASRRQPRHSRNHGPIESQMGATLPPRKPSSKPDETLTFATVSPPFFTRVTQPAFTF